MNVIDGTASEQGIAWVGGKPDNPIMKYSIPEL
jgi:hypothetical protein